MTTPHVPDVTSIPTQRTRHRVLLAGHRPPLRRAYAHVLLAGGYDVTTAADGAEALELLDAARPDVILAEASMPVLDGISLVRLLRAQVIRVPVVLTADDRSQRRQARQAGADGYLVAPFGPQALIAALAGPAIRGRVLRDRPVARRRRAPLRHPGAA